MRLQTAYVRFYKSFNYDYLRKNHPKAKPSPWDTIGSQFFPYVRIPLDPHITTIVGANESGKSHLLSAIEKGVSGEGIAPEDFCRYSQFFAVIEGEIRKPDFGLEWGYLDDSEKKAVRAACGMASGVSFDRFLIFRANGNTIVYAPKGDTYSSHPVEDSAAFSEILPRTFTIDSEVALPESVSIRELIDGPGTQRPWGTREERSTALESLGKWVGGWFQSAETVKASASEIVPALAPVVKMLAEPKDEIGRRERARRQAQIDLARDLILKVARISTDALGQLATAIRRGNDGHANGIIEKINAALAARLNFPRFWVQDRDFSLIVSPREHDLVFTIRDRTGTQYAFKERSSGLKYFLPYYIQYLAHETAGPATELLLMDEPDAYLSSQAQQDLLKVFQAYAHPEAKAARGVQVIYVTHSPFLIDKNHADRIRVLEKGSGDEGTRVVRDAARNHYEPLRSAFGAYVGETTFIGHCNLMVEGTADQILLAGSSTYLRARGAAESHTLDLNRLTIVPAGSATQIPYLVYLARGRDIERPAVIVLLDSDAAGKQAVAEIARGPRNRPILRNESIITIASLEEEHTVIPALAGRLYETEDLIPLPLCVRAARQYAELFWADSAIGEAITETAISQAAIGGQSVFKAIQTLLLGFGQDLQLAKSAFARIVVDLLPAAGPNDSVPEEIRQFEANMKALFSRLREAQRAAEKERNADRVSHKINRLKHSFTLDHPEQATRETARIFLRELEEGLDETIESDAARNVIHGMIRDHMLTENILELVPDFERFKHDLNRIQHAGRLLTQQTAMNPAPNDAKTSRKEIKKNSQQATSTEG